MVAPPIALGSEGRGEVHDVTYNDTAMLRNLSFPPRKIGVQFLENFGRPLVIVFGLPRIIDRDYGWLVFTIQAVQQTYWVGQSPRR